MYSKQSPKQFRNTIVSANTDRWSELRKLIRKEQEKTSVELHTNITHLVMVVTYTFC